MRGEDSRDTDLLYATETMKPGPTNLPNVIKTCFNLASGVLRLDLELRPFDVATEFPSPAPRSSSLVPSSTPAAICAFCVLLSVALSKETIGGDVWRTIESSATAPPSVPGILSILAVSFKS